MLFKWWFPWDMDISSCLSTRSRVHIPCEESTVWNLLSVVCVSSLPLFITTLNGSFTSSWIYICKIQLTSEIVEGLPSFSWFMCHQHLSGWTSDALESDNTTKIWSWSALSIVFTVWKQIVTEKIFFFKRQERMAMKHTSFWKLHSALFLTIIYLYVMEFFLLSCHNGKFSFWISARVL